MLPPAMRRQQQHPRNRRSGAPGALVRRIVGKPERFTAQLSVCFECDGSDWVCAIARNSLDDSLFVRYNQMWGSWIWFRACCGQFGWKRQASMSGSRASQCQYPHKAAPRSAVSLFSEKRAVSGIDGISHRIPMGSARDRQGYPSGLSQGSWNVSPLNAGITPKKMLPVSGR